MWEFFYPRGGWARAFEYVKLRLNRLPGSPEQIARGIWAGVFASFTPFFGLHFLLSALIAVILRGNILAALLGTFIGNPLTYVPIAWVGIQSGHMILGTRPERGIGDAFGQKFVQAGGDLWYNFMAFITGRPTDWTHIGPFWDDIFLPFMLGGAICGAVVATLVYYLAVPVIRAFQIRRRAKLRKKLAARTVKQPTGERGTL